MKLVDTLKALLAGPGAGNDAVVDPVAQAELALVALAEEIETEETALARMQETSGETLVTALASGDSRGVDKAEAALEAQRRRVQSLRTAQSAVQNRIRIAKDGAELQRRQAHADEALRHADRRRVAIVRLEKLLTDAAEQFNIATSEGNAMFQESIEAGMRLDRFMPGFNHGGLGMVASQFLAGRTERGFTCVSGESAWTLSQKPGLVAMHDSAVAYWFPSSVKSAGEPPHAA